MAGPEAGVPDEAIGVSPGITRRAWVADSQAVRGLSGRTGGSESVIAPIDVRESVPCQT